MRNLVTLFAIVLFVSTVRGQGTDVRPLSSFSGVRSSEGIDVYLKKGAKESARVETNGIPTSAVLTEISGSYLKVHMASGNWKNSKSVKVYVTYVHLGKLSASSASSIFSDGVINSPQLEISANSGGSVEVTVETDALNVESASAGDVTLEGKATSLSAEAASAGEIDAYKLTAENVTVSASSAGDVKITVTKSLIANAASAGDVRYRGNPSKTMINATSGGSVKKSSSSE